MASVKEHFYKGIGYIKYDIARLEAQKAELQEFIGYHKDCKTVYAITQVSKRQADIESIEADLYDLKQELQFYKEYFKYSQADIDNVPVPTAEQVEKDWKRILKERDDKSWTQADTDALMQRVHDLDKQLGRI